MPAHRPDSAVGEHLPGGNILSYTDIRANRLADVLAKRGAATYRLPKPARLKLAETKARVAAMAKWVGRVTYAANNWHEEPWRDSAPTTYRPRHAERQRVKKKRARPTPAVRPPELGGHDLSRTCDGWRCSVCRGSSGSWRQFSAQRCVDSAALRWARRAQEDSQGSTERGGGHNRYMSDSVLWCARCGCYAERFAVGLAKECLGRPSCDGKAFQLRRLLKGRHPASGVPFIGQPSREPLSASALSSPLAPSDARGSWGNLFAPPRPLVPTVAPSGPSAADRLRSVRARVRLRIALKPSSHKIMSDSAVLPKTRHRASRVESKRGHSTNPDNSSGVAEHAKRRRVDEDSVSSGAIVPHGVTTGAPYGSQRCIGVDLPVAKRNRTTCQPVLSMLERLFLDDALLHRHVYACRSGRFSVGGASSSSGGFCPVDRSPVYEPSVRRRCRTKSPSFQPSFVESAVLAHGSTNSCAAAVVLNSGSVVAIDAGVAHQGSKLQSPLGAKRTRLRAKSAVSEAVLAHNLPNSVTTEVVGNSRCNAVIDAGVPRASSKRQLPPPAKRIRLRAKTAAG